MALQGNWQIGGRNDLRRHALTDVRGWLNGIGLVLLIAIACLIPLFLGRYAISQEESPAYFVSLYGLVPFYPGQNRILALLQFIASPARTIQASIWIHYASVIVIWSVGLAGFLIRYVPRIAGLVLPLFLALFALVLLPFYELVFSPIMPYLTPLGLSLAAVAAIPSAPLRLPTVVLFVLGCVLVIVAAGVNPTSAVIAGTFSLALVGGSFLTDERAFGGVWKRAYSIASEAWPRVAFGLIAALAVLTWTVLQNKFAQAYPQSVMSNYSTGSYSQISFSLTNIVESYQFTVEGMMSRSLYRWIGPLLHCVVLGVAPFGVAVLWIALKKGRLIEESLVGLSLYVATVFGGVLTAINSHVLLVQGAMRGRYFLGCLIVFVLAFAVLVCVSLMLSLRTRNLRVLNRGALALSALLALGGSAWALGSNPRFYVNVLPRNPDSAKAAEAIRSRGAIAVVGDYWVVWPLHLLINTSEGHTPDAVPVTIRTEALPLRALRLWERSLIARDGFLIACVRHQPYGGGLDVTPPGNCIEKLNFNIERGGFPKGKLSPKGSETFGALEVTYFEFSRSGTSGGSSCAADDVVFRAAAREKHDGGSATYLLRDGGFVLAGVPRTPGTRWWLAFKNPGASELENRTVSLTPGGATQFTLGSSRFSITADDCRVMVDKDTGPLLSHHTTEVVIARQ
jgi:hypothetical protein